MARFQAADTQVLGVSVDSVFCHANWARSLGGVSFPLLADFQPKGAVAASFGHYLDGPGLTDRATIIIDKEGIVRYSESVTPAGKRDIDALVAECEKVAAGSAEGLPAAGSLPAGTELFVKSSCGHSVKAMLAVDNLHAGGQVAVRNVTDNADNAAALMKAGGQDQAPCLVIDGKAIYEADAIVDALVSRIAPLA